MLRYRVRVTLSSDPRKAFAPADLGCAVHRPIDWADPVDLACGFADEVHACVLLSMDHGWSYVLRQPDAAATLAPDDALDLAAFLGREAAGRDGDPPFQGGVIGLATYELSARLEPTAPQVRGDWPDLTLLRYPSLLAFHAGQRCGLAVGRGSDRDAAAEQAKIAMTWLDGTRAHDERDVLAATVACTTADSDHGDAVAATVARIAAGELFQANLARPWQGHLSPGVTPYDLFRRLALQSPAGFAAYLRLPGRALVSNSPERFLSVRREGDGLWVESQPIKGTRPRSADPACDAALANELLASAKDQAENLMIVDLMRNDLARVCDPGTVTVPERAALLSYANVHHLVSRVRGRLKPEVSAWDAFCAAFPPGSVTGAPKLAAMSVIACHESPRGPYCGSLFWAGLDGTMEASVLIRTVTLTETAAGWTFEARAGGGIVADSDPMSEVLETSTKIGAILRALMGQND